ncbi:MAG: hypothetical protein WDM89_00305 [Rhizomicrobium sp.]
MKIIFVIIAVVVALVAIFLFLRSRVVEDIPIRVNQISAVVAQLKATGRDEVLCRVFVSAPGSPPQDDGQRVNLQFSIDKGRLGLDWVLLSDQNIADEAKIAQFIKEQGFAVNKLDENGVNYLRVEDGDIVDLGIKIATKFYRLNESDQIDMIVDSFDWKT